jgi:hypothetical protein
MNTDTYFSVTVDTEADDAWQEQDHIGMRNMSAIPRFQALCEDYSIVPTYLLTYECAVREEAIKVLKPISDEGRCEIGYHFHSWTTPPFEKSSAEGVDLKWRYAYQYELPEDLFIAKAQCLLKTIQSAYGVRPTAHRAGRWGIDQRTVDWLIDNDFLVDTSVVPLWNLSRSRGISLGGPSFFSSPRSPYFWPHSVTDITNPLCLMEVPLTVYAPQTLLPTLLARYLKTDALGAKTVARLYMKLIGGNGALRPNPAYAEGCVQNIIQSNLDHEPTIINMMVHSSELMLGQSPFSRTEADLARLWERLRQAFALVRRCGIKSLGISACALRLGELLNSTCATRLGKKIDNLDFATGFSRMRSDGLLPDAQRPVTLPAGSANFSTPRKN